MFNRLHRSMAQSQGGQAVNHIGDTNKMVSDTPRMDLALRKAQEDCTESYLLTEGLKLERELNEANKRIKELEAKVNELNDLEKWLEGR